MKLVGGACLTLGACLALSGCPSKTVQEGGKSVQQVTGIQCATERDMVMQAVEAYTLLTGAAPVDEAAMVPDYMRTLSATMDLDELGNVVAAPGSGCT